METIKKLPQTILITGASGDIGFEVAKKLNNEGNDLVLLSNTRFDELKSKISTFSQEPKIKLFKCDITNSQELKNTLDTIFTENTIDTVIHCAGAYLSGDEWNLDEEIWRETFNVNLFSALVLLKKCTTQFLLQGWGNIITIGTRYAISPDPEAIAYSASKAALVNATLSHAKLLAPVQGRANIILPGGVRAGYWLKTTDQNEIDLSIATTPLKRFVEPEEIAGLCSFLISEYAKNITGQSIEIDGGYNSIR